jgi:tetratricopeptide (TPR) repeat protein
MHDRHPDRGALERYLDDGQPAGERRALQRHLFACPVCEDRMIALLSAAAASPHLPASGARPPGLVERSLHRHQTEIAAHHRQIAAERLAAGDRWREIAPHPHERRRRKVAAEPRYHSWGFFELLVERARLAGLDDPQRAEELLRLALDVADRLDPKIYGRGANEAARTRAWSWLANAWRLLGDFRQAELAFQTAELYLAQSLDPLDEALLLELEAPLRRGQRRFAEALALLDEAIAIYREVHEPHAHGRALIVKGIVLRYQGDFAAAEECFRTSLFLLDSMREPRLMMITQYNLIGCLKDAGRIEEAAALLPDAKKIIEEVGTRSDRMRARWTEGRVDLALGRLTAAEAALLEVSESFLAEGRAFDAAQVSLDLAVLYLRQQRLEETKQLAAELLAAFQARDVHQEALASLIVLQQAAEREQLTRELVEEVAAYLLAASSDPYLKFRG